MARQPPMSEGQRRRRRAAATIVFGAVALSAALVLYGWQILEQVRGIERQWREDVAISSVRGEQLFRLQSALGYGGFIDNFKTFILRGDIDALDEAAANLRTAAAELDALADSGFDGRFPALIERLRFVVEAYKARILMADDAFGEGYSASEIDNLVIVEDKPALAALRAISDQVRADIMAAEEDTRRRLDEVIAFASLGVLVLPLIALVVWLMLRFLRDMMAANEREKLAATRTEGIIDTSPEAMIVVDADGRIVRVNEAALKLFGYDRDAMMGMEAALLTPPEHHEEAHREERRREIEAFVASGGAADDRPARESWATRADGEQIAVRISSSTTGEGDGTLMTMVFSDETLRRTFEQGLIEAREAAERASDAKSEFLANISHEVRTPINAIIGLSGLAGKTRLTEQQRDYLEKIHASGRRLLDVVNDMLDFARIDAGQMQIDVEPFDLDDMLDPISTVAAVNAEAKDIEIVFRTPRSLPSPLIGDGARIGQVLSNLVGNAVKFTDRGSVIVGIDAEPAASSSAVVLRFSVTDTGIGIPAGEIGKLFEAFTQADTSATRQFGGAGLGLAICKNLVEAMDGEISA